MARIALAALAVLLLAAPTSAQSLAKVNAPPPDKALHYTEPSPGKGKWIATTLVVDDQSLRIGQKAIELPTILETVYERRRGSFRGVFSPVRVRHILTVHYKTADGRAYDVVEMGKDIADRISNELKVRGIAVEARDTSGR